MKTAYVSRKKLATADLATRLKIDKSANKLFRYRKLCEKIGVDLTTVGRLSVSLKLCERLPEALYSINMQAPAMPVAHSTSQAVQSAAASQLPASAMQNVNPSTSSSSTMSGKENPLNPSTTANSQLNRFSSNFFFKYYKHTRSINIHVVHGALNESLFYTLFWSHFN